MRLELTVSGVNAVAFAYLDCSNEAGALREPSNQRLCWLADEIDSSYDGRAVEGTI